MLPILPSGEVLGKNSLARSEIEYRIIEYKIQDRSQKIFTCGGLLEIVTLDDVKCGNHFQKVDLISLIFFRTEILVQISSSLVWDHHKSGNDKSPPIFFRLRRAACCSSCTLYSIRSITTRIRELLVRPGKNSLADGRQKIYFELP